MASPFITLSPYFHGTYLIFFIQYFSFCPLLYVQICLLLAFSFITASLRFHPQIYTLLLQSCSPIIFHPLATYKVKYANAHTHTAASETSCAPPTNLGVSPESWIKSVSFLNRHCHTHSRHPTPWQHLALCRAIGWLLGYLVKHEYMLIKLVSFAIIGNVHWSFAVTHSYTLECLAMHVSCGWKLTEKEVSLSNF